MTSQSLKRALELELAPPPLINTSGSTSATSTPTNLNSSSSSAGLSSCDSAIVVNGSKRRCSSQAFQISKSPFKESSTILGPLSEEIESFIKDEIDRINQNNLGHHEDTELCNGGRQHEHHTLLTVRQTQIICEKLIREREHKLREEYDKILACKLAEHDRLAKANYLNSYAEKSNRLPTSAHLPQTTASNPSINALAAAISTIQRSAAASTAAAAAAAVAPQAIPDLTTLAASLSAANSHPNVLTTSQLAFNLQQQAAAAVAIQAQQAQQQQVQQRGQTNTGNNIPVGPVLLASNLDEQLATPESLFTLFGVFGDVIRVKILFNKKDNALIQMADASQAQVAQGNIDKQKIFGKVVRVTPSKHQVVQMPRDGNQSDAGLTKDFTNSPLHRFKIPGSRNYLNIYPPSNTLHISNIPPNIDEDSIQRAFKEACDFECSTFKFFPNNRKMALMKFDSIEYATIALIKMHNFQISSDNKLRVSFSKSVIQQRHID